MCYHLEKVNGETRVRSYRLTSNTNEFSACVVKNSEANNLGKNKLRDPTLVSLQSVNI